MTKRNRTKIFDNKSKYDKIALESFKKELKFRLGHQKHVYLYRPIHVEKQKLLKAINFKDEFKFGCRYLLIHLGVCPRQQHS